MELSFREWVFVVGAQKESAELSKAMGGDYANSPANFDSTNSELPNGGARVVRPATVTGEVPVSPFLNELKKRGKQQADPQCEKVNAKNSDNRLDEVDAGFDQMSDHQVSDHRDLVPDETDNLELVKQERGDQELPDQESWGNYRDDLSELAELPDQQPVHAESQETVFDGEPEAREELPAGQEQVAAESGRDRELIEETSQADSDSHAEGDHLSFGDRVKKGLGSITRKIKHFEVDDQVENATRKTSGQTELIVINVESRQPEGFSGYDLRVLLEACGMEHGDMMIYHRREDIGSDSPVQFSVANSFEPGYFDPATMNDMRTRGVSFFLNLPGPTDNMTAFDYMVETAQCVAKNLDGELKDENRSALTSQTLEHYRQRVREFERKQLSLVH